MESIPTEIFLKIFRYLSGKQIVELRKVCTRLRNVVDSMQCDDWRKLCFREFGDVKRAYEKSGLSGKEFYKSMSLWLIVSRAQLDTFGSADLNKYAHVSWSWDRERKFILLKNGLISFPQYQEFQEICIDCGYYDLITYFDCETLCSVNMLCFDMIFDEYDENEDIIVFRENEEGKLFIVPKTNNNDNEDKPIFVENLKVDEYDMADDFYLAKNSNDVYYFQNKTLWTANVIDENGNYKVEKREIGIFKYGVLCISKMNTHETAILTTGGEIYHIINNEFVFRHKINTKGQPNTIIQCLKQNGMDWTCLEIYRWLVPRNENDQVQFTKMKNTIIHQHGKVIILGTKQRILHIYNNPFKNGQLNLNSAKPDLKIDLNIFHPIHEKALYKDIDQIDVIEIPNGHRIILIYSHKLVVVDLLHTKFMKRSLKQIIKARRDKKHKQRETFDDYEDPYLDTPI